MTRQRRILLAAVPLLAFALSGCGGAPGTAGAPTVEPASPARPSSTARPAATARPTAAPAPTAAPTATPVSQQAALVAPDTQDLVVHNIYGYQDSLGYFHVVGSLFNGTSEMVTAVELKLTASDAAGATLLSDGAGSPAESNLFAPLVGLLPPGEFAPFEYQLDLDEVEPASFNVTINDFGTTSQARGAVAVERDHLVQADDGSIYILGEIVNTGDQPVDIFTVSGALIDNDRQVIAAQPSYVVGHYLAPAGDPQGLDRTPFRVDLRGPIEDVKLWATFVDAAVADPVDLAIEVSQAPRAYVDASGDVHLAGSVSNQENSPLTIGLVAGLYDADGVVLDADIISLPFNSVPAGATLPYGFATFAHVNSDEQVRARIDRASVQPDLRRSYTNTNNVVSLPTEQNRLVANGDSWTVTGALRNDSGQPVDRAMLVIALRDGNGALLATTSTGVFPASGTSTIAPGEAAPYEQRFGLDPSVDPADVTIETFVEAYVS